MVPYNKPLKNYSTKPTKNLIHLVTTHKNIQWSTVKYFFLYTRENIFLQFFFASSSILFWKKLFLKTAN